MVVRFEVDAFDPSAFRVGADELAEDLKNLGLSDSVSSSMQKAKTPVNKGGVGLKIMHGGLIPPHTSIVELKATSEKSAGRMKWSEIYPQLYISQTPWMYKAIHRKGSFHTIEKKALASSDMDDVAERLKASLQKLILALHAIQKVISVGGGGVQLSLVLQGGELRVFRRTTQSSCLPKEVMARFEVV